MSLWAALSKAFFRARQEAGQIIEGVGYERIEAFLGTRTIVKDFRKRPKVQVRLLEESDFEAVHDELN